jgi:nucleoid-associated protein YgaU
LISQVIPKGGEFRVLFNPTEYRLNKTNQFNEVVIPGASAPLIQFGHGDAQTLTMQLFFDTYDPKFMDDQPIKNKDVRFYTQQVTDLLKINEKLHAPPVCRFSWGSLIFHGVLQQADLNCTLFLPSGIPVRATVSVTFKQFFDGKTETGLFAAAVPKKQSANYYKRHVVRRGDTLSSIAGEEYDDPAQWRAIAEANALDDPLAIRPGQELVIPPNE